MAAPRHAFIRAWQDWDSDRRVDAFLAGVEDPQLADNRAWLNAQIDRLYQLIARTYELDANGLTPPYSFAGLQAANDDTRVEHLRRPRAEDGGDGDA